MELYNIIVFFLFGLIFGSFFNVVGYRLPKEESIFFPSSHCPKCGHKLGFFELIPVFSYLFLRGKCHSCKTKISWFYPLFELITGLSFALVFYLFGFSSMMWLTLVFVSTLIIIFISDYQTMIIPDEVIIASVLLMSIIIFTTSGFNDLYPKLLSGTGAFVFMYLLKSFGDFVFKKESMGGGDIKLMFVIGMYLGWEMAIFSVFFASFIGLPVSLVIYFTNKNHVIPFGPFLSISAMILALSQINFTYIINLLS